MRENRVKTTIVAIAVFVASVCAVSATEEVSAQDNEEIVGLTTALKGLNWGVDTKAFLAHFKKKKLSEFQGESKKIRDAILKEKRRNAKLDEYKAIEDSFRSFKGSGSTGYEVSVITGEFAKNNGESLMIVRDDVAQRYYFFLNRRLWKMAVSYNASYVKGIDFDVFVDQVSRKYGDPSETVYDADEILRRAMWTDEAAELRIEDKSDFFGTFIMVFSDLKALKRRGAMLKTFTSHEEEIEKKKIRAAIQDIKEEGGVDADEDVVDSIVGVDIKVNLERGLPEGVTPRRIGDPVAKSEALPEEKAKKRKKAKKRWKAKSKGKAKGKSSDDLIIY